MRNDQVLRYATVTGLGLVVVLLVVVIAKVRGLERRFIAQQQGVRALGEGTLVARAGSKARGAGEAPPGVRFLHPEVENVLKPADTRWPAPGASLDGVLRRGWDSGDPKGFNPLLENASDAIELIEEYALLPLAKRNAWTNPDTYHGELAFRVEVTDDFKEYTAYLERSVKWHTPDGVDLDDPRFAWLRGEHEVTAHDVVFTLDLVRNPQVQAGPTKSQYEEVESYRAADDYTFVVRWKKKQYTNLAFTLALHPMPRFLYGHDQDGKPFPKETLGLRFNQHFYNNKGFVGAGPYRMTGYVPGSHITIERSDAWLGDKPAIRKFVYPIYADKSQTAVKLRSGEVDIGELLPGQYRKEIHDYEKAGKKPENSPFFDGRIQCQKVLRPAFTYIGWNADRSLFADKRVRRAMTHAFDRKRIIDNIFVGLGRLATGPYLPDSPDNDPSIRPIPFDLAAAKRLLAEAGWSDSDGDGVLDKELDAGNGKRSPFEFRLTFGTGVKEWEATSAILREDLLKIGVKMNVESLEWSVLQKRKDEAEFDAVLLSWLLPWDPDLYQLWHSSQADIAKGSNRVGFRNKQADAVIEELRVTFDRAKRQELFRRFHRIVDDEQPFTFFLTRMKVYCASSRVKNLIFAKLYPVENALPWWVESSTP